MNKCWKLIVPVLVTLQFACPVARLYSVPAQDIKTSQAGTRIELLEEKQKEKDAHLRPAAPGKVEQALVKYVGEDPLNKYMGGIPGLRLRFGSMPMGAGFGLGAEYARPDLAKGNVHFQASAIGSNKLWYLIDTELRFPHLARRYLDLNLQGLRLDADSIDYYGPGPKSQKEVLTDYRREESTVNFCLAFKPTKRHLSVGFATGYLWLNVGPGHAGQFNSSERQYLPSMAPGIDRQTNYLQLGPFLEVDSRDKPKDPHGGTHLLVKFFQYSDREYDQYSFRQIDGSVEQYLPFFNKKRVIALRARSLLSYPGTGNSVPFYMQPTLGGTSDLRGYRRYRFNDDNSFLINAEYRWEVFTLMDAALFTDAGKVFHRDGDFNLRDFESDVGFGVRFKTRRAVVFRIDTAVSHEGYGLWFTFDHVY
jgi:outer membrane protein assembly factor BamA